MALPGRFALWVTPSRISERSELIPSNINLEAEKQKDPKGASLYGCPLRISEYRASRRANPLCFQLEAEKQKDPKGAFASL